MIAANDTLPETNTARTYTLPDLILHPFADPNGPNKLVESSRASLIIQGLLPQGEATQEDLNRTLLEGRYAEVRMLFYVGKDVLRWIEQCLDHMQRTDGFPRTGIVAQSVASLLIQNTPANIVDKLRNWGVSDFKAIFSRGLGLNAIFTQIPPRHTLMDEFLRNYFRYADQLFFAYMSQGVYSPLTRTQYGFELYSSGEYSRMLERAWE